MGKFQRTIAICDRCGMEHRYTSLSFQVVARKTTSTLVCSDCLDEDHPQWFPARNTFGDPAPVPNARPEQNIASVYSGFSWGPVGGMGTFITCGVSYDFDMLDPTKHIVETDILVQEDGDLLTQEDDGVFLL